MKKLKMVEQNSLTFQEGCNKYLDDCRARNLREGTINHYRQSYVQFGKFFDMNMQVCDIDEQIYQKYVVFLRETLHNDVSINSKGSRIGRPPLTKDEIPPIFYRHYPSYVSGELNVSELARVCDMSRTRVYRYIKVLK